MSKLRVASFSVSLDGFAAGPNQSLSNPMGEGGMALHKWVFGTKTFLDMHGEFAASLSGGQPPREDADDTYAARGFANIGAWILGRNMFGPERGPWTDNEWKGWWGDNPPYHVPVFILTRYARPPIEMAGGTTFYFVTGGVHEALAQAKAAAGDKDVRLGGVTATVRGFLQAGLIDELHLVISPVVLGSGEALWAGLDVAALGYQCTEHAGSTEALHVVLTKQA